MVIAANRTEATVPSVLEAAAAASPLAFENISNQCSLPLILRVQMLLCRQGDITQDNFLTTETWEGLLRLINKIFNKDCVQTGGVFAFIIVVGGSLLFIKDAEWTGKNAQV